jgi:hypothetical protein
MFNQRSISVARLWLVTCISKPLALGKPELANNGRQRDAGDCLQSVIDEAIVVLL